MAKHIIKHDRDTTLEIKGKNQVWELAKQAEITVLESNSLINSGIYEAETSKNNVIRVNGDITMLDANSGVYGILSNGINTTVRVGASSEITATVGIGMESDNSKAFVFNAGWINATEWGIELASFGGKVVNNGTIVSQDIGILAKALDAVIVNRHHVIADIVGIYLHGTNLSFTNSKHGLVSSGWTGISADSASGDSLVTLNNAGTIHSYNFSLVAAVNTTIHAKNTGVMIGDVILGNKDDIFDTGRGTMKGVINGYGGNDIVTLDKADTQYVEYANEGNDTVKIAATYTLGENIENLTLLGKGKFVGNGNELDNVLTGNKSTNGLYGQAGNDILNGRGGNDFLAGGTGADTFIFAKGGDRDTIFDFTQGEDHIQISGLVKAGDFTALLSKMTDTADGNVAINFGDGDVLTINGITMMQLQDSDFILN